MTPLSEDPAGRVRLPGANEMEAHGATHTKGSHMRITVLSLLAMTLAVLTMAQAQQKPQDVVGWRDARWGMTMDEVRTACPEVQTARDKKDLLVISNLDFGGVSFKAEFFFGTDTKLLRNIVLTMTDPKFTSRGTACAPFDGLATALMEKLGPPASVVSNSSGRKATWLFPSTTIYLNCTSVMNDFGVIRDLRGMAQSKPVPAQFIDTLIIDYIPPERTAAKSP